MIGLAVDHRNGVLLITFASSMTVETLAELDGYVKDFVAREGTMATIIHFTDTVSVEIEASSMANRGKARALMSGQPRILVTADPLLFGLLRLYTAHQENGGERPPAVVRSLAEATAALCPIEPEFEPVALAATLEPRDGSRQRDPRSAA